MFSGGISIFWRKEQENVGVKNCVQVGFPIQLLNYEFVVKFIDQSEIGKPIKVSGVLIFSKLQHELWRIIWKLNY